MKSFNKGLSVSGQYSRALPRFVDSFGGERFVLNKLVQLTSLLPTFDHSLVVLLFGQYFGGINLFWPIRFQYSICALVKYCK